MTNIEGDLMALDLEYRLTFAHRIACECAAYFARRREVLIPAVLSRALVRDEDPVDLFARFARGVHQRHLDRLSLATHPAPTSTTQGAARVAPDAAAGEGEDRG